MRNKKICQQFERKTELKPNEGKEGKGERWKDNKVSKEIELKRVESRREGRGRRREENAKHTHLDGGMLMT